jgi:NADH-quinone oxidoreductase subunit N
MYFDAAAAPFETPIGRELGIALTLTALFTAFFVLDPLPLLAGAETAAAALFP